MTCSRVAARAMLAVLLCGAPVAAEPRSLTLPDEPVQYTEPAGADHLRTVLEEVVLLGGGLSLYFSQQRLNSVDWDLGYDWDSFRDKLVGRAYAFDTNHFDTNFVSHAASGTFYYLAARSNRVDVLPSLTYAAAASTLWEFLGEFREQVSVNDVIVTPMAGFVIGEATTQLAAFFDRGCPTFTNELLGFGFGPPKSAHDALDDLSPLRASDCDRHGFTRRGEHLFRLAAGGAAVWERAGSRSMPRTDAIAAVDGRLVSLDEYGRKGRELRGFSSGNIAELGATAAVSDGQLSHYDFYARVVPAGFHYRSLARQRDGRLRGHELIVGGLFGVEYLLHRYARDEDVTDRVFILDVPAIRVLWRSKAAAHRFEVVADVGTALGGIDALALPQYRNNASPARLTTVAQAHGYNHAFGITVSPAVRYVSEWIEISAAVRSHRFWAVRALDREPGVYSRVPVNDSLRRTELSFLFGLDDNPVRPRVAASALQRWGSVGSVTEERSELSLGVAVEARF